MRFTSTAALAVFLAMMLELQYRTTSESEAEENVSELVKYLVHGNK